MIAAEITIFVDSVAPGFKGTQAPSYSRTHRTVSDDSTGPSFLASKSDCEKEDEDDCKEFCGLSEQTGTCRADGNKVTCYCKGGKSDSNCEERCLLCMSRAPFPRISLWLDGDTGMPDKSALEEASRLFKLGGSKIDELWAGRMGLVGCVGRHNGHGFLCSGHKLSHNLTRRTPFPIVSLVSLLAL